MVAVRKGEKMATLNYILSEKNKLKLVLLEDKIEQIDKRTSKYFDKDQLIHDVIFDDLIGRYIYDNEDILTEEEAINYYITIEYQPTIEDIHNLYHILRFRYMDKIEITPIFQQDKQKQEKEVLLTQILKNNKKIGKYLEELKYHNKYYLYLRIVESYYNQKEQELPKKLLLK